MIDLEEPGTLSLDAAANLLSERFADRVVAELPAELAEGIKLAKIAGAAVAAITAAATMGPAAILGAVYAGFRALNDSLNDYARRLISDMKDDWADALDALSFDLIQRAQGRILIDYQPADVISMKRAQAKTATFKKDGLTKLSELTAQFRPGYVVGVKRPLRSDYIAATVPILVFTGWPLGATIRGSIYGGPTAYTLNKGDGWENSNAWRALGVGDTSELTSWPAVARELSAANACPPVRAAIKVAPGLAPAWGPYGEIQPTSARLAQYAAYLLGAPPSDLDDVSALVRAAAPTPELAYAAARRGGLIDLHWAREQLARTTGKYAPRGDAWAGPWAPFVTPGAIPDPPPGAPPQAGNGGDAGKLARPRKLGAPAQPPDGDLMVPAIGVAAALLLLRARR